MSDIKFAYEGEARLLRWADSGGAGRTITIQLDEAGDVHPFKHLNWGAEHGQRMKIACVLIDDHEQPITPEHAQRRKSRKRALNAPSVPEKAVEPAKVEKASGGEVEPKPKSRIRTASAMCEENLDFRRWLRDGHPTMWTQCYDVDEAERAIRVLKWVLGIKSRKELDTDPEAAARFDALRTSFELRDLVRE